MTRYFRVRRVDEIVGWNGVRHPQKHVQGAFRAGRCSMRI